MPIDLTKIIDLDLLSYFKAKIDLLLAGKVNAESGKRLMTDAEGTKLSGVASGAQANVIEGIQKNGTTVSPVNKIVNLAIPTKTSDITNDSGFITTNDIPEGAAASTTAPQMDGTADVGTSLAFARGDHVHPSDTSKVDKVNGKGLSTEDYTTAEKSKLGGVAAGAQVNVIESVSVNGSALTPSGKSVNVSVPVAYDANAAAGTPAKSDQAYIPAGAFNIYKSNMDETYTALVGALDDKPDYSDIYTKTQIDQKLASALIYKGTKATVSALPSSGNTTGDVWHVTADGAEYAWNGSAWEELGTAIDLSGYAQTSDFGLATTSEIDALFT